MKKNAMIGLVAGAIAIAGSAVVKVRKRRKAAPPQPDAYDKQDTPIGL